MVLAFEDIPVVPLETEVRELQANIRKMELRYECSSEYMYRAVLDGRMRETFEVCEWMADYYYLQEILASDEYAALNGSATTS